MNDKIIGFTQVSGARVAIPVCKITGITEILNKLCGKCFVATGADNPDGGENGWYIAESYNEAYVMLEAVLKDN